MTRKSASQVALFAGGFVACGLVTWALPSAPSLFGGDDPKSKQAVLASLDTTPSPMPRSLGDSVVADAAAKVDPAVVEIHTVGKVVVRNNPFGDDPIMRQFFGGRGGGGSQVEPRQGAGSGVIISSDGYIITNNHVVANTDQVNVSVNDKTYSAKVIGADPVTDIAVVKIKPEARSFPVAQLGNSDNLRIGDWAIAVGNPLNIGTTVTLGIISAVNRTHLSAESHPMQSVIQTDAAINPGNSGGALADINGRVIGINEAIYSPTGSYVGIGFAIPINAARKIAAELIRTGHVERPYLGISMGDVSALTDEARSQMGIVHKGQSGVVVAQVYPGSPAAAAGLQTYDTILDVNKKPIKDTYMLNDIISHSKVGSSLLMLIERNGQDKVVSVTLKERPATFGASSTEGDNSDEQP